MFAKAVSDGDSPPLALVIWLYTVAALVFLMILLGGYTRLMQAGLSIVEWRPITGVVPPLNENAWQESFNLYQAFPEFQKRNFQMTLAEYKLIYLIEYFHRLLGRIIGMAYLIPLGIFYFKRQIPKSWLKYLIALAFLGACQGFMGWFMVKSGLIDQPRVSHYRLVTHLMLALLIYAGLLWGAFCMRPPKVRLLTSPAARDYFLAWLTTGFCAVVILSGGLMAGTHAGYIYPTFPDFGGEWLPTGMYEVSPFWLNWLENLKAIHFNHRILAFILFFQILVLCWRLYPQVGISRKPLLLLLLGIGGQLSLGILTVLWLVAWPLALAHQGGALLVFSLLLYLTSMTGLSLRQNKDKPP